MRQLKIEKRITNRTGVSDKYLQEITRKKLLTPEEEHALIKEYKNTGSSVAREKIIEGNLRFVVSVAKQYTNNIDNLQDLIQEGNIGLLLALDKFDPTTGYKFISYAVWWIRQCIMSHLSNHKANVHVPTSITSEMVRMNRTFDALSTELGREPTEEELYEKIAPDYKKLSYRSTEYQIRKRVKDFYNYKSETSLDEMLMHDGGSFLYEMIPVDSESFEHKKNDVIAMVRAISKNIPKSDVDMLLGLYGLGDTDKVITRTELAEKHGIDSISRLEYLAGITVRKLRRNFNIKKNRISKRYEC